MLTGIAVIKLFALVLWWAGLPTPWAALLFLPWDPWVYWNIFAPGAAGIVPVRRTFQTGCNEVWLTIDDGPDEHDTPRILDALDRHGARATFFVIGERAARHPELVAEIARRGHEVAHHTHTHPHASFWCAGPARTARELDAASAVLKAAGVHPRRFRAPVGIKNLFLRRALAVRGLTCVAWSVRSGDVFAEDPERVVSRVMRDIRPGGIVLLHEGEGLHRNVRVTAIERLLDAVHARGLRCVIPADSQLR